MKILKATGQIDSGRKTSSLNRGMWSVLGFAGLMMMLVFNVIPVAVTQSGPALKNNAAAVWDAFNYGASGADGGYWAALTQEQLNASSGGRSMDYILADDNLTGGRNAAAAQEWEGYRASQNPRAGAGGIDAQSAEDTGVYNPSFKAAAHTAQQEAAAQAARARQAQRNGLTSSAAAGGKGGGGSSGGSSFSDGGAGGSAGGSYDGGGSGRENASQQNIPQAGAAALSSKDITAARGGRAGAMGGFGVRVSGDGQGGSGQARYSNSLGDLATANRYSSMGKGAVFSDMDKGAAFAAAALDGSTENQGITMSGAGTVQQQALSALQDRTANDPNAGQLNATFNDLQDKGDQLKAEEDEAKRMRDKLWLKLIGIMALGIGGIFAIGYLGDAARGSVWGWIGLIAAALAIIGSMAALIWAGGESIPKLVEKLKDNRFGGNAGSFETAAYWIFGILSAAVIGAMFYNYGKDVVEWIKGLFKGKADGSGGGIGKDLIDSVIHQGAEDAIDKLGGNDHTYEHPSWKDRYDSLA